jgi:putative tricarboxylic transport membrane protein
MYIGNVMLLAPNSQSGCGDPQGSLSILYVLIVMFQVGAYSVNNNVADVLLVNIFGMVGYLLKRYEFEAAPLILGLVLGPMFENSLRRSLLMSEGSPWIFFQRPISAVFLLVAIVFLICLAGDGSEKRSNAAYNRYL